MDTMNTLFLNKYTRDMKWTKDFYRFVFFFRPVIMVINIICFIALAGNICLMIAYRDSQMLSSVIMLLLYFLVLVVRYSRCVNLEMKRCLEMYGKFVEIEVSVSDEKITTKLSTGATGDLLFENVKKVINSKKYIYLQTHTKLLMCFKKDSFTLGSSEEFLEFLKNKGFRVR